MSNNKKYQVFVSSTYTDLIDARQIAINMILESYNFPVGMEMFGADNDEQWAIIKDAIDVSDYYVLILGHRYGSISEVDGISFTEKEFDYAIAQGVKTICFVRKDDVATLPTERETDLVRAEKLLQFRSKVLKDRVCRFWTNTDDLKHEISSSLFKTIQRHGGVGWVRGNQASGQLAEEIAKLSEENRNLRFENEQLKQVEIAKQPILKVSINDITNIPPDEDNFLQLQWRRLREDEAYERPEKRIKPANFEAFNNMLLIQLGNPDGFIDDYNTAIDQITDEMIHKHNHALQKLYQIEAKNSGLNIKIDNIGNLIANKVSIEIEFPDFILVINNDSKYGISYHKKQLDKLLIPMIKTPEQRANERSNPLNYSNINKINEAFAQLNSSKTSSNFLHKNVIYIEQESLLHSRGILLENYYLIPKSKSEGFIKVNIICAEYSEPSYFEIPIEVI